jgi:hypothetical protein
MEVGPLNAMGFLRKHNNFELQLLIKLERNVPCNVHETQKRNTFNIE